MLSLKCTPGRGFIRLKLHFGSTSTLSPTYSMPSSPLVLFLYPSQERMVLGASINRNIYCFLWIPFNTGAAL